MHERTFSVEWDGVVRGVGRAGPPLSPILFLIYLALTIYKMEKRIRRAMPGLEIEINNYVNDIALTFFDGDGIMDMGRMVAKGGEIMREVAEADGIPLELEKEKTIVFGRKGRKAERVKWLGISLNTGLQFQGHIITRVKRARQMLGNLNSLGNSSWGMTPISWGQASTGMIRAIALWGAEAGWRGLEKWRKALKTLQYQCLRRYTGAHQVTAQFAVDRIAGVEPIETKLDAIQAPFVARSLGNPTAMEGLWPADFGGSQEERRAGRHWTDHEDSGWLARTDCFETVADRMVEKLGLEGGEEISWGGTCRTVKVLTNKVGSRKMSKEQWEERIKDITMGED